MGYRSSVRIKLLKTDFDELKEQLKFSVYSIFDICKKRLGAFLEHGYKSEEYYYFGWNNIHWYENDPECKAVQIVMNFIANVKNAAYLRLGDDYDDVDERCKGCFDFIGWKRSILEDEI